MSQLVSGAGIASQAQKNAAIKLNAEIAPPTGRGPDWDIPLENSIAFGVEPLVRWHQHVGTIKPLDHSIKLHVRALHACMLVQTQGNHAAVILILQ